MLSVKTITLLLALALIAFASVSTSAMALEFLGNVAKNNFKFKSGSGELVDLPSGAAIKCKEDSGSGEVLNAKELTFSVDFHGCTFAALAAVSLGDKEGLILLANLNGKLCTINKANKKSAY